MGGNKKARLPAKGSRLGAAESSAVAAPVAFDAPLQCRFKHSLDFGTQSEFLVGGMDAVVVAGVRDQRSDHVHDVDHALDSRAVIHQHRALALGVVPREAFVAVEATFVLGIDLPDGNRNACAAGAAPFHRGVEVELQPVIWKLTRSDQLGVRAAVPTTT